jgi:hypothetical protein
MPGQRPNKEINFVIHRIHRAQHARSAAMIIGIDRFARSRFKAMGKVSIHPREPGVPEE